MASAAFWPSPCCMRLLHLGHLLGQLLQAVHLRLLLLELVELLLQLAGLGHVALALLLVDLLLEIFHRLLVGFGGGFQLVLHLLELLGELLLVLGVELAFEQLLFELLHFVERFLPIALLHGLGRFFGGAGAEILHALELLLELVFAAELLAALFELLGQVVELHRRLGAVDILLLLQVLRALFDLLEQTLPPLEVLLLGFLALLFQLLAERFGRLLDLLAVSLATGRIVAAFRFAIVDERDEHEHDRGRHERPPCAAVELHAEFFVDFDAAHGPQRVVDDGLAGFARSSSSVSDRLLATRSRRSKRRSISMAASSGLRLEMRSTQPATRNPPPNAPQARSDPNWRAGRR